MFHDLLFWWNFFLINCTILITNNVNTILGNRNLIKGSRRGYTMLLVRFDSMWITLYTMLNPKESCKTYLVPRGKWWCINSLWSCMKIHYRSFDLVTSPLIHLKDKMTCINYHFNENFPAVRGEESFLEEWHKIICNTLTLTHLDPHTNQCELEVWKIIHLQGLVNQLPNAFNDAKKVINYFDWLIIF